MFTFAEGELCRRPARVACWPDWRKSLTHAGVRDDVIPLRTSHRSAMLAAVISGFLRGTTGDMGLIEWLQVLPVAYLHKP